MAEMVLNERSFSLHVVPKDKTFGATCAQVGKSFCCWLIYCNQNYFWGLTQMLARTISFAGNMGFHFVSLSHNGFTEVLWKMVLLCVVCTFCCSFVLSCTLMTSSALWRHTVLQRCWCSAVNDLLECAFQRCRIFLSRYYFLCLYYQKYLSLMLWAVQKDFFRHYSPGVKKSLLAST